MATGVDHFGAIGPLWWVLGCLWGAFGVLLGRLWGPKRRPGRPQGGSQGHLGVQRASGRVLGSFWGWFWCRKRVILRCQNLKILLAGPMKSQYFGFGTLDTKMVDFGSIWGGGRRFSSELRIRGETLPPEQRLFESVPLRSATSMGRYIGISVHLSIGPSMYRHIIDLGPPESTLGSICWVALGSVLGCQTANCVAEQAIG